MLSNNSNDWVCPACKHRYPSVSPGEQCPRDGGILLKSKVYEKYSTDPLLGTCIDGRYHLIDILGQGGFGTVYLCFDTMLASEFALKTISNAGLDNREELKQRFRQESLALSQLTSEHVVRVYETGEAAGTLYMVLELIRGLSLKQHLAREGRLSLIDAARIVSQILSALEHAHAAGLVHRDLKPSNILFTNLDAHHIKLIDFGIAKSMQPPSEASPLTRTGLVIGTVQYMAPEQLRQNLPVGPATDLYATGILFYQFMMGETPFTGSQAEIAAGHLYQYPPKLDQSLNINQGVSEWLQTALAKEPAERFPNAMTMRVELAKAMGTSEENLNTTLPINNDTIRMTPDLSFMHNMLNAIPSEAVDEAREKGRDEALALAPDEEANPDLPTKTIDSGNASLSSLLDEPQPDKQGTVNNTTTTTDPPGDDALLKQAIKSLEKASDPKIPAATQELSPLLLQKATTNPVKNKTGREQNNQTALADIPVMLFTEGSQEKQEPSVAPSGLRTTPEQQSFPPPIDTRTIQKPSQDSVSSNTAAHGIASGKQDSLAQRVDPSAALKNAKDVAQRPSTRVLGPGDSKLAPKMPELLDTSKNSTSQKPVQFNANKIDGTQINFELPDALGWWVVPLVMVLFVIGYFIWF